MAFALTPATAAAVQGLPGDWLQISKDGVNAGNANVEIIDIVGSPGVFRATRGIGKNAHVITIRRTSLFVAVAQSGAQRVMTSPDGLVWTLRNAASARSWKAVCYSPTLNLYCAVAGDGVNDGVMTSPDGTTWTSRVAPNQDWESVCWNGSVFVAGAQSGVGAIRIMTSPDGVTWTLRTSAFGGNWNSMASNGVVDASLALSTGNQHTQYSLNHGVTWANGTDPDISASFLGLAWDGTNFIGVMSSTSGSTKAVTSPDGQTWTARVALAGVHAWTCIAVGTVAGVRRAVAIAAAPIASKQVMTSDDHGLTWTGFAASINNTWRGVAWNGMLFAAVADVGSTTRIMTSPDGQVWTTRTSPADNSWSSICSNLPLF